MNTAESRASGSRYAWYVVGVLLLAYTFSFIDRQILSLLVAPIERDLHINDTEMSLLQGFAFSVFYIVLGLPIARWADIGKRNRIILFGVVAWSLFTAACGLAQNFWTLFVLRIGVGAGEAALIPASFSLFGDYFSSRQLGLAGGVFSTGIYIGGGLALVLGGLAVHVLSGMQLELPIAGSVAPWQLVFFIVGLPGLLVALLILTIREPPRTGPASASRAPLAEMWRYWRRNWRTFMSHNLGFAMLSLVSYGTAAWIPTYFIRDHGWSAGKAGVVFGIVAIIFGTAGVVFGGWLADWFVKRGISDGRMRIGLVATLGAMLPVAFFPMMEDPVISVALLSPGLFLATLGWGAAPAGIQELTPNRMRAQFTALYIFIVNLIGLGLGPTSYALFTDYVFGNPHDLKYSLLAVSVLGLSLSALLFWRGLKYYRGTLERMEQTQEFQQQ